MFRIACLVFLFFVQTSCSKNEQELIRSDDTSIISAKPTPTPYLSEADFNEIQQRGALRLIAPRFDGADALPRGGISVLDYQKLAEEFALEYDLRVEWLFVDGFDQLLPALIEGKGDVVVTNMTVTEARAKQVQFTTPIAQVSEVLVSKKSLDISEPADLHNISITVPKSTAYIKTLNKLGLESVTKSVASRTSDSDLLALLSAGEIQATVIDSDIARKLLPIYPDLEIDLQLKKNRPIAWAVRKTNRDLLFKLNEFLVSHHVKENVVDSDLRDWSKIKASGKLKMLTLNNPASYFMWRGELMGFEYELMKKFADDNNLHLSVVIKNSIPELFSALKKGEGDVIAASLTKTAQRESIGISFTRPYLMVKEQVVGRAEGPTILSLDDLSGHTIGINPATVFYQRFLELSKNGHDFDLVEINGAPTEELIARVVEEEFDFTVADSHLVAIEKSYHQNVKINVDLTEESSLSWGLRSDQNELNEKLNSFIKRHYKGLFYNVVFNKYFKNEKKIKRYQDERLHSGSELSPYDNVVKQYAQKYNMDWRLIVSQMYQESKFNPKAKSFAGARGLMQVMPRTARELGFTDLHVPENSIAAGIVYMEWLTKRFPGELDFQERIYFTLAAYNAGTGHVRDARKLAEELGFDSNKWFGNVEKAMLKLSNPQYYKKARFGYVRGREPVAYVREIRDRYIAYLGTQ